MAPESEAAAPAPTAGDLLAELADAVLDGDHRQAFQTKLDAVYPRPAWDGREPTKEEAAEARAAAHKS